MQFSEEVLSKYPKLIRQYIETQCLYPDAIVLTEVGSFYEIWQLDELNVGHAIKASQIMNITLTRRDKSDPTSPRMAGVPNYTVENYIKKLVDAGELVVVVSQAKNGKKADQNKNIERYIEKIVSPATYIDKLGNSKPNYFASCFIENDIVGISLIDVGTGEVRLTEMPKLEATDYLLKHHPAEILFCSPTQDLLPSNNTKQMFHFLDKKIVTRPDMAGGILSKVYDIANPSSNNNVVLSKLGLEFWTYASLSLANLLNYLVNYNPLLLKKLGKPKTDHLHDYLFLPKNAFLSLDLLENPTAPESNLTLLENLGNTKTSMGKRLMRQWISNPLVEIDKIKLRQNAITKYIKDNQFLEELKKVYDLARLQRRMTINNLNVHEIVFYYQSLSISNEYLKNKKITQILEYVNLNFDLEKIENTGGTDWIFFKGSLFKRIKEDFETWQKSNKKLELATQDIKKKLNNDKLRVVETKEHIQLVGSKGLAAACKEHNIKFTLKTSEIKIEDDQWNRIAYETFGLKQKYLVKAEELWNQVQTEISETFSDDVLKFSEDVAEIDCLSHLAKLAIERHYIRPEFIDNHLPMFEFKNIRHPVVEMSTELSEAFTPNDIKLDSDTKNTMVIYGANSSGKSTLLKSLAINIIMAQMGSYIPCSEAKLTVFENIMTRMTTYDQLSEGLSTFTMEMIELQLALKKVEEKTLFLFDEIGRGTSVEDGEALAFATLEYLRRKENKSLTLFATHYHKLFDNIKNFDNLIINHVHCEINENDEIVFYRKLMDGPGTGSYGIVVAKSCGLPEEIIRLAQNYNKKFGKTIQSRYNSSVIGSICPICNVNQVSETHHIVDQLQGKVKKFIVNGVTRDINDKANLILICPNCHDDVTQKKLHVEKRKTTDSKGFIIEVTKIVSK